MSVPEVIFPPFNQPGRTKSLLQIVSREDWLGQRRALLTREKALLKSLDALSAERRTLPAVVVTKPYQFTTTPSSTTHTLSDLFADRKQLIVYHFMLAPDWDAGCKGCCVLMDNLGDLSHLNSRDTTFVAVSRAPPEKLQAFQERMGWKFPWYSSGESGFNQDFGVTLEEGGEYNYDGGSGGRSGEQPGASVFLRGENGEVLHTYSTYGRGLQLAVGTEMWLDITPLGRQGHMGNFKRHDEY